MLPWGHGGQKSGIVSSCFRRAVRKIHILLLSTPCLHPLLCGSYQHLEGRKSFFCLYCGCVSAFPLGRLNFTVVNNASNPRAPKTPNGPSKEQEIAKSSFLYLSTPAPCPITYILYSWNQRSWSFSQPHGVSQRD